MGKREQERTSGRNRERELREREKETKKKYQETRQREDRESHRESREDADTETEETEARGTNPQRKEARRRKGCYTHKLVLWAHAKEQVKLELNLHHLRDARRPKHQLPTLLPPPLLKAGRERNRSC